MEAFKALLTSLLANHKLNMTVAGLALLAVSQFLMGNTDAAVTALTGAIAAAIAKFWPQNPSKPQNPPSPPPAVQAQEVPKKVPHEPFRRFVAALLLAFGLWHVGHALAATLPASLTAARAKKCDRPKCDCGCAEGRECDCKLIQAPDQASEFSHLPSYALCKQNQALAASYCESLEKLLDLLSGRVIEPEEDECVCGCCCRRGPEIGEVIAGGWKVDQLQGQLEDARRRRLIWDTAAYATCHQVPIKTRLEFSKRLRILVGERAYVTGEFPGPIP